MWILLSKLEDSDIKVICQALVKNQRSAIHPNRKSIDKKDYEISCIPKKSCIQIHLFWQKILNLLSTLQNTSNKFSLRHILCSRFRIEFHTEYKLTIVNYKNNYGMNINN